MSQPDTDNPLSGRGIRIFGLPAQFVIVVALSLALTVYFAGWAASASIEARDSQFSGMARTQTYQSAGDATEAQTWERAALLVCPLH